MVVSGFLSVSAPVVFDQSGSPGSPFVYDYSLVSLARASDGYTGNMFYAKPGTHDFVWLPPQEVDGNMQSQTETGSALLQNLAWFDGVQRYQIGTPTMGYTPYFHGGFHGGIIIRGTSSTGTNAFGKVYPTRWGDVGSPARTINLPAIYVNGQITGSVLGNGWVHDIDIYNPVGVRSFSFAQDPSVWPNLIATDYCQGVRVFGGNAYNWGNGIGNDHVQRFEAHNFVADHCQEGLNPGFCDDMLFDNCTSKFSDLAGFYLNGGPAQTLTNVRIIGGQFINNGQNRRGSGLFNGAGVAVGPYCQGVKVIGVDCRDTQSTPTQTYSIYEDSTGTDYTYVLGVNTRGVQRNVGGPVIMRGAHSWVKGVVV